MLQILFTIIVTTAQVFAFDTLLGFQSSLEKETRNIEDIYQAALNEGGVVTLWHGGDEADQRNALKQAFETRFPGMTLNVTVGLSKYLDGRLDEQLANGGDAVYVDSIILQTLQDYPRWAREGALLHYAPRGFDQIEHSFKDDSAAWYGLYVISWSGGWNTDKLPMIQPPTEWSDWLQPEFKDRLVLTYPNDDDAVTWAFYLMYVRYTFLQSYSTTAASVVF
jgi:ABC-type Fe3+ transport system substrate-binding protein